MKNIDTAPLSVDPTTGSHATVTGRSRRHLTIAVVALGLAVGLTGCGLSSDNLTATDENAADQPAVEAPAAEPAPEATPEAPPAPAGGTRANPFPVGTTVSNEDWSLVLGTPREAWGEISAENQFNSPPEAGLEFWIVPVTATYQGATSGTPWLDITVKFVGDDSVTYEDYCGVIPGDLDEVGELYAGGVAEGNVCVAVPAGAPGLWTATTGWGEPSFFTAR
ncbi:hypothetical protein [Oerskovia enterophila]|uniref:hypothetical protein n=1 Tax=Oerskovia enterophila TaxID=43678 RepID=UPI003826609B